MRARIYIYFVLVFPSSSPLSIVSASTSFTLLSFAETKFFMSASSSRSGNCRFVRPVAFSCRCLQWDSIPVFEVTTQSPSQARRPPHGTCRGTHIYTYVYICTGTVSKPIRTSAIGGSMLAWCITQSKAKQSECVCVCV